MYRDPDLIKLPFAHAGQSTLMLTLTIRCSIALYTVQKRVSKKGTKHESGNKQSLTTQKQIPHTDTTSYNSRTQSDRIPWRAEPRTTSVPLPVHQSSHPQCNE